MKRPFILLGSVFAAALLIAGALFIYAAAVEPGLDKEAKAFVDGAVPAILRKWDVDDLMARSSQQLLKATSKESLEAMFNAYALTLGALKQYKSSAGRTALGFMPGNRATTAQYVADADFANGSAKIYVTGIKEAGGWKVSGISVQMSGLNLDELVPTDPSNSGG